MIPPLAPGQSDEEQNMVGWKDTFNMRQVTFMNIVASQNGARPTTQSRALSTMCSGCISSPVKSLEILRKNLQGAINKDLDSVIKKYLDKFFQPAIHNIRANLGQTSVNDEQVQEVCRQILDEAKLMYLKSARSRDSSPYDLSDSEAGSIGDCKMERSVSQFRKRRESDTDSETNLMVVSQQKRSKYASSGGGGGGGGCGGSSNALLDHQQQRCSLIKREAPKWNSNRMQSSTRFIMGAKANKALGYGLTRGRLYVRHPELVRYSGDQEDKEWLARHNLMPASGGKAYMMLLEDIQELAATEEYRNNGNLQLHELIGFEVPTFMLNKIRTFVETSRTDKTSSFDLLLEQSMTPTSTAVDSAPSTPSDTMQLLECHSVSTISSKHSDTNQLPEMSPGSNHSFLSGPSPIPQMLMGRACSDNSAYPATSDNSQEF